MKRKVSMIMILLLLVSALSLNIKVTYANEKVEIYNDNLAKKLEKIGVFKGSDKGYELDRKPTRLEGAVILVRLLGKEKIAKDKHLEHPFEDVPQWASDYIGYMYENGLTNGISKTEFGANDFISLEQFTTFTLRALGYDDSNGEFKWNESLEKAVDIKMFNNNQVGFLKGKDEFLRDDVVLIAFFSLKAKVKNSSRDLITKLIEEDKSISVEDGLASGLYFVFQRVDARGMIVAVSTDEDMWLIENDHEYKSLYLWNFNLEEQTRVRGIIVIGDDMKKYLLISDSQSQFEDLKNSVGKRVEFKGESVYFPDPDLKNQRYRDTKAFYIDDFRTYDLEDSEELEPVAYNGKFANTGDTLMSDVNIYDFETVDGEKYRAIVDCVPFEIVGYNGGSFNFLRFVYRDIWLKGYRFKNSDRILVTEFSTNNRWDKEKNAWVEEQKPTSDTYVTFYYVDIIKKVSESSEEITYIGNMKYSAAGPTIDEEGNEGKEVTVVFTKDKLLYNYPVQGIEGEGMFLLCQRSIYEENSEKETLEVFKWNADNDHGDITCFAELQEISEETDEYVIYGVKSFEGGIKSVKALKNNSIGLDANQLKGKRAFIAGKILDLDLEVLEIKKWIETR